VLGLEALVVGEGARPVVQLALVVAYRFAVLEVQALPGVMAPGVSLVIIALRSFHRTPILLYSHAHSLDS
jgi:hypothetical protein